MEYVAGSLKQSPAMMKASTTLHQKCVGPALFSPWVFHFTTFLWKGRFEGFTIIPFFLADAANCLCEPPKGPKKETHYQNFFFPSVVSCKQHPIPQYQNKKDAKDWRNDQSNKYLTTTDLCQSFSFLVTEGLNNTWIYLHAQTDLICNLVIWLH